MGTNRSYGEACGLAIALDLVGERWALLVVRELMLGPKRFTDLREGLPGASANILSERLRELEAAGVIRRRTLPPPAAAKVYELTDWGRELEPALTGLAAWAARSPSPPPHTRVGLDSIVLALRALFDAEGAAGLDAAYELRLDGEAFRVQVSGGEIEVGRGTADGPRVTIECEHDVFAAVLTGHLPLGRALDSGEVEVSGGRREAARFLRLFPMPERCAPEIGQAGAPAVSRVGATR